MKRNGSEIFFTLMGKHAFSFVFTSEAKGKLNEAKAK
jgi:hypothetical protein